MAVSGTVKDVMNGVEDKSTAVLIHLMNQCSIGLLDRPVRQHLSRDKKGFKNFVE